MKFESTLSKKQIESIFLVVVGILLVYLAFKNVKDIPAIAKFVGLVFILIGIMNTVEESLRRYKITHPFNSNNYDSKAEERIADYFKIKNIIYYHHPRIRVPKTFWIFTFPFVNIRLEPDFFLPEFNVFVEYWGMIEDERYKKESYDFKTKLYKENDIDLISLYPRNLNNLDWDFTSKLLELIKRREGNNRKWR
jgi:hypothetical protein